MSIQGKTCKVLIHLSNLSEGSEDMSHIRTVELQHDASGSLGLSIAGGLGSNLGDTPVVVANMTPNGPAEKSRKLKVKTE